MNDLEMRRKWAHRMKYAVWLLPLVLTVLVLDIASGDLTLQTALAVALIGIGAIGSYRLGAVWETHWYERLVAQQAEVLGEIKRFSARDRLSRDDVHRSPRPFRRAAPHSAGAGPAAPRPR